MEWLSVFNYLFWLPVAFWIGFFFFSRYVAYPITLKKLLRQGEVWVYIPKWWKSRKAFWVRSCSVFLSVLTVLLSTVVVCWAISLFSTTKAYLGFVIFPVFVLLAVFLFKRSSRYVYRLQRATYFLYYKRFLHDSQKSGQEMKDADLRMRSSWEIQRTLLRAEKSGKLLTYLLAAANTQKIPKDLYAEALR